MSDDPKETVERAEAIEAEVAPREDPNASAGAEPDDGVAPDSASTND